MYISPLDHTLALPDENLANQVGQPIEDQDTSTDDTQTNQQSKITGNTILFCLHVCTYVCMYTFVKACSKYVRMHTVQYVYIRLLAM